MPSIWDWSPSELLLTLAEGKGIEGNYIYKAVRIWKQPSIYQTLQIKIPPYTGFTPHRDHQYGKGM